MKYSNSFIRFSFIILLFAGLSFAVAGCGNSTGYNGGGNNGGSGNGGGGGNTAINFDSGTIAPGDSYSYTFDNTGSVNYICTIHPQMTGSVTIEDDASTEDVTVTIKDFSFNPDNITIGPGTTVTWVNEDDVPHTATSQNSNNGGDSNGGSSNGGGPRY